MFGLREESLRRQEEGGTAEDLEFKKIAFYFLIVF